MLERGSAHREEMGTLRTGGTLLICDTAPSEDMLDGSPPGVDSFTRISVKPGSWRVEYMLEDQDDDLPLQALFTHEDHSATELIASGRVQIEGGRLAVSDLAEARRAEVRDDLMYEAADRVHHGAGLAISLGGDGPVDWEARGVNGEVTLLVLNL